MLALLSGPLPVKAQTIPTDAQTTCTVAPTQFAGWFETGTPSLNGVVKPADSLNFLDRPNCSFYQWAEQMFLWLTSPAPPTYCGGGAHVFDSSAFFDVSPPDPGGNRVFISHTCSPVAGVNRFLSLRASQPGPHGLPVIFNNAGRMLEVETPLTGPTGKPLVFSSSDESVEVQRITVGKDKKPIFLDKAGKPIAGARPILHTSLSPTLAKKAPIVQKFMIGPLPIFVDPFGNVVEFEQGQAQTGGVLMAQTGSLVYYAIMTNDVYAYFLTGLKDHQITPTGATAGEPFGQFPTTPADLAQITAYASTHAATFPDPNALAVEIKTSWVEASSLPDPGNYVTMTGTIPTYDTSNPNQWTPNGTKTVQLALVGMHVVGSTGSNGSPSGPGHPEMIWATFEHLGNTPLATYAYNSTTGPKSVNRSTAGTWLFSKSNSSGPFNCMHMIESGGNIVPANPGSPCPAGSFTASDTLRQKAWGAASDVSPNPIDGSAAASNTEIIAINNSVRGMMPAGDVRSNYYMAGATWTISGGSPNQSNQVGTSMLAGSTMETYQQGTDTTAASGGSNCFSCHFDLNGGSSFGRATTDVSHIFNFPGSSLQPLSLAPLSVRVSSETAPPGRHKILITVTNSGTGGPIVGATVNVTDPDSSGVKASGLTSGAGTVTLTYFRCFEVFGPPDVPKPVRVFVPCDGDAVAAGFAPVTFDAP
ncbi:MAG TPA: hypothetical protein VKP67_10165 [Xanthobacteraceae bacterium]|nr:hypothetical protein [Xanthobacteraceae bacterium]